MNTKEKLLEMHREVDNVRLDYLLEHELEFDSKKAELSFLEALTLLEQARLKIKWSLEEENG